MSHALSKTSSYFDADYRAVFLKEHGWEIAEAIKQDSSIRRYFRLNKGSQTAILMESVPDSSPHATVGHSIKSFITISKWLNDIGVNAPDIYESDEEHGLLILQDFGGMSFKQAIENNYDVKTLYTLASDTLDHISRQDCPLDLPNYYESHVHKMHRRVIDWYVPLERGQKNEAALADEYQNIWSEIENTLPPCPNGFTHIDYHAENLMWMHDESGIKRCGILDFQGAMIGPAPYDLTNLLEDARMQIPREVKHEILSQKDENFHAWFRVLATQFHCRVIGQFIKFALMNDNPAYLVHIPRLEEYLQDGLKDPLLKPLKAFFDETGVNFQGINLDSISDVKGLIDPAAS